MSSSFAPRRVALSLLVGLVIAGMVGPVAAFPGAPWFQPGRPYDSNFPDPAIIEVDGTYYAYATSTGGSSVPVMTSTDLSHWTAYGDALGRGPSWSPKVGDDWSIWAPSVTQLPTGGFLAAYAARTGGGERRCVGTARAASPLGPFVAIGNEPFVCEPDPNGALDPFLIVDAGVPWLIWKNEGVPVGHPTLHSRRTGFWSRALTDDGAAWRPGSAVKFLIETTEIARPWQGTVIENPSMVAWDGAFFLAYSANRYDSTSYATGWARCATPGGPCTEPVTQPLLVSDATRLGPGGPAPFVDASGVLRLGYHAWDPPATTYPASQRRLHIDAICVSDTSAVVYAPHDEPFCDVGPGRYYTDAVRWLAENEITTGVTPTTYGANGNVTRGQMATFLWRLMGTPATSASIPFGDVGSDRFYSAAVRWLADTGATTGVSPTRFDPDGAVSRAQMATFLWRLVGEPDGPATTGFGDVSAGRWYSDAVAWLADAKVTTGVGPGRFDPQGNVTRAQMAAFLCRLSGTEDYASSGAPTPGC